MKSRLTVILLALLAWPIVTIATSTQPSTAPAGTSPALWNRMVEISRRGEQIQSLTAEFQQKKFTAMLKQPLVSRGQVHVSGSAMRWDTASPEPSILRIDSKEVELFYPKQETLEIYPIDQKLASLAASPLPRLDVLRKYFTFQEIPVADLDKDISPADHLALAMAPSDPALRQHVQEVRVLLDDDRGVILRAEMVDPDGDRTLITFFGISTSRKPGGSLQIELPSGVKIVHPLEMMQGDSGQQNTP